MSDINYLIKEKKFYLITFFLVLYIVFNFFGGDRVLIEFFKKKKLLINFKEKNIMLKKEIHLYQKKNEFLSTNINTDYLDQVYRDYFVLGKKGEKIYLLNTK